MDPLDEQIKRVNAGLMDPVAERCVRLAARVRFLERRLDVALRINQELNTARKAISEKLRKMKKGTQ
jgi:hypothetical protein